MDTSGLWMQVEPNITTTTNLPNTGVPCKMSNDKQGKREARSLKVLQDGLKAAGPTVTQRNKYSEYTSIELHYNHLCSHTPGRDADQIAFRQTLSLLKHYALVRWNNPLEPLDHNPSRHI